jgi:hypothetical protein
VGRILSSKNLKISKNSLASLYRKAGKWLWSGRWWRKAFVVLAAIVLFITSCAWGIGEWYIHKHSSEPLTLGTSFISEYAESFGLDPQQTLNAIFSDLGMRQVRLVSYWSDIEKTPGTYDFSGLDWQFAMANKYHAKVSLAVGMRQPRWPECHEPEWVNVDTNNKRAWEPQLYQYMIAVIDRYKNNPALADYELENEFFMKVFGECKDFSRDRLIYEYNLVKHQDPHHKVIVSRSDNWIGIPVGQPKPDEFAISVYKRVWDNFITKRYFEYPLPAWFYASLAGSEEIYSGRDMIVHELQAEPWTPRGMDVIATPLAEQYKSMNAKRMKSRIEYGTATGMRTIDLWGAEWWYWLKVDKGDSSVWNAVKQAVAQAQQDNNRLAGPK